MQLAHYDEPELSSYRVDEEYFHETWAQTQRRHNFFMNEFRVKYCKDFTLYTCRQSKPFKCLFAHYRNHVRRAPVLSPSGYWNYVATPCVFASILDCPNGTSCPFSHKVQRESIFHPSVYKTQPCTATRHQPCNVPTGCSLQQYNNHHHVQPNAPMCMVNHCIEYKSQCTKSHCAQDARSYTFSPEEHEQRSLLVAEKVKLVEGLSPQERIIYEQRGFVPERILQQMPQVIPPQDTTPIATLAGLSSQSGHETSVPTIGSLAAAAVASTVAAPDIVSTSQHDPAHNAPLYYTPAISNNYSSRHSNTSKNGGFTKQPPNSPQNSHSQAQCSCQHHTHHQQQQQQCQHHQSTDPTEQLTRSMAHLAIEPIPHQQSFCATTSPRSSSSIHHPLNAPAQYQHQLQQQQPRQPTLPDRHSVQSTSSQSLSALVESGITHLPGDRENTHGPPALVPTLSNSLQYRYHPLKQAKGEEPLPAEHQHSFVSGGGLMPNPHSWGDLASLAANPSNPTSTQQPSAQQHHQQPTKHNPIPQSPFTTATAAAATTQQPGSGQLKQYSHRASYQPQHSAQHTQTMHRPQYAPGGADQFYQHQQHQHQQQRHGNGGKPQQQQHYHQQAHNQTHNNGTTGPQPIFDREDRNKSPLSVLYENHRLAELLLVAHVCSEPECVFRGQRTLPSSSIVAAVRGQRGVVGGVQHCSLLVKNNISGATTTLPASNGAISFVRPNSSTTSQYRAAPSNIDKNEVRRPDTGSVSAEQHQQGVETVHCSSSSHSPNQRHEHNQTDTHQNAVGSKSKSQVLYPPLLSYELDVCGMIALSMLYNLSAQMSTEAQASMQQNSVLSRFCAQHSLHAHPREHGLNLTPYHQQRLQFQVPEAERIVEQFHFLFFYKTAECRAVQLTRDQHHSERCTCGGLDYHRPEESRRRDFTLFNPVACADIKTQQSKSWKPPFILCNRNAHYHNQFLPTIQAAQQYQHIQEQNQHQQQQPCGHEHSGSPCQHTVSATGQPIHHHHPHPHHHLAAAASNDAETTSVPAVPLSDQQEHLLELYLAPQCSEFFSPLHNRRDLEHFVRNAQLQPLDTPVHSELPSQSPLHCDHAHTLCEIMYSPLTYKTTLCRNFDTRLDASSWICSWRRRCHLAHGPSELRTGYDIKNYILLSHDFVIDTIRCFLPKELQDHLSPYLPSPSLHVKSSSRRHSQRSTASTSGSTTTVTKPAKSCHGLWFAYVPYELRQYQLQHAAMNNSRVPFSPYQDKLISTFVRQVFIKLFDLSSWIRLSDVPIAPNAPLFNDQPMINHNNSNNNNNNNSNLNSLAVHHHQVQNTHHNGRQTGHQQHHQNHNQHHQQQQQQQQQFLHRMDSNYSLHSYDSKVSSISSQVSHNQQQQQQQQHQSQQRQFQHYHNSQSAAQQQQQHSENTFDGNPLAHFQPPPTIISPAQVQLPNDTLMQQQQQSHQNNSISSATFRDFSIPPLSSQGLAVPPPYGAAPSNPFFGNHPVDLFHQSQPPQQQTDFSFQNQNNPPIDFSTHENTAAPELFSPSFQPFFNLQPTQPQQQQQQQQRQQFMSPSSHIPHAWTMNPDMQKQLMQQVQTAIRTNSSGFDDSASLHMLENSQPAHNGDLRHVLSYDMLNTITPAHSSTTQQNNPNFHLGNLFSPHHNNSLQMSNQFAPHVPAHVPAPAPPVAATSVTSASLDTFPFGVQSQFSMSHHQQYQQQQQQQQQQQYQQQQSQQMTAAAAAASLLSCNSATSIAQLSPSGNSNAGTMSHLQQHLSPHPSAIFFEQQPSHLTLFQQQQQHSFLQQPQSAVFDELNSTSHTNNINNSNNNLHHIGASTPSHGSSSLLASLPDPQSYSQLPTQSTSSTSIATPSSQVLPMFLPQLSPSVGQSAHYPNPR